MSGWFASFFGANRIEKVTFLILLICYVYFMPRWADPNQNSRLDMVFAVVEDGTFQIDPYVKNTVDYAKVGDHYYSDKAPGVSFVGIPVYALLKGMLDLPIMDGLIEFLTNNEAFKSTLRQDGTGVLEQKVRFAIAQVILTWVTASLPSAVMGILLYRITGRLFERPWTRIAVVLGYGLLTPAFAYAGAFYGHQLSATCLLGAFYLTFMGKKPLSTKSLQAIGFLLGYSVITEYPSVLIVGVMTLYTFSVLEDRKRIMWIMLTGGIVALFWMFYNQIVFGSPVSVGYSYSELWIEQHETGFMSLTLPHWDAIWGITFSRFRGLFLLSPWLLLTFPGFILWGRSGHFRTEFWVALLASLSMFVFNSASIMWWGGFAVGPRYLLPALPFLSMSIVFAFSAWMERPWMRGLLVVLFIGSLFATWGLTLADQAFPPDTVRNPLVDYAWPNWQDGNIARNLGLVLNLQGFSSLLPLGFSMVMLLLVLRLQIRNSERCQSEGVFLD